MSEYLLTSEDYVKANSPISDNVASKYVLNAIRKAQETYLKRIIGKALLDRLKELLKAGTVSASGNEAYSELLDEVQDYLTAQSAKIVCENVSYKIANAGVVKTSDENVQNASQDEIISRKTELQSEADGYAYELQRWLLENRQRLPELSEYDIDKIHSNLYSAATGNFWLGGRRGKGVYRHIEGCSR